MVIVLRSVQMETGLQVEVLTVLPISGIMLRMNTNKR